MAEFYKLKPGDNRIQILPPTGTHFVFGPWVNKRGYYFQECTVKCPVCRLMLMLEFYSNDQLGKFKEGAD